MHSYFDLVERTAIFTLNALKDAHTRILEYDRQMGGGTTIMVKNLQANRLQKAITAVGMFSMFESILQDALGCSDGFVEALRCLTTQQEATLAERFSHFSYAINVLKHGQGRSYQALLQQKTLPFRIHRASAPLFIEGDITAVTTLVDVDDQFVLDCAKLIREVTIVIRKEHPHAPL